VWYLYLEAVRKTAPEDQYRMPATAIKPYNHGVLRLPVNSRITINPTTNNRRYSLLLL
jgi:hypothetical protein